MIKITIEIDGAQEAVHYCSTMALTMLRGDEITGHIKIDDSNEPEYIMCMLAKAELAAKDTAIKIAGRCGRMIAKRIILKKQRGKQQ